MKLYYNLLSTIIKILAENGETRTLTLVKLTSIDSNSIKVQEPMVFEHKINIYREFYIPFTAIEDGKYLTIDWGDGNITCNKSHAYTKKGSYRIKIYNYDNSEIIINRLSFWADNIDSFISIGRIRVTSLSGIFATTSFNGELSPNWDTTKISDISKMFYYNPCFNRRFGQNWDTGNVTDMSGMFSGTTKFNQQFGQNWDTGNVTDMSWMFSGSDEFNQQFGQNWDMGNVTDMGWMFYEATKFNQSIGQNWNIKNVKSMRSMFESATSFEKLLIKWDIPQNTDVGFMFWRTKNN